jgi:hypothetical protein
MPTSTLVVAALSLVAGAPRQELPAGAVQGTIASAAEADRIAFVAYRAQADRLIRAAESPRFEERLDTGSGSCALVLSDSDLAKTEHCVSCHGGGRIGPQFHTSHPVDVDHEMARMRPGSALRPASEVVKRGLFLPDGKVRCTTCHHGRSPFRFRLAIPANAEIRDAVDHRDPRTYDPALRAQQPPRQRMTAAVAQRVLPPGTEVSPTPLCKVCHGFD